MQKRKETRKVKGVLNTFVDAGCSEGLASLFTDFPAGERDCIAPLTAKDPPPFNEVFLQCLDGGSDIADPVEALLEENKAHLEKKADNLSAKLKSSAGMTSVKLQGDALSLPGLVLTDKATELLCKPFLCAVKHFTWTWDTACWPLPGVPCLVCPIVGDFFSSSATSTAASSPLGATPSRRWTHV